MTKKKKEEPRKPRARQLTNYQMAAVMAYLDPNCNSKAEAVVKAYPKAKNWTKASVASYATELFKKPYVDAELTKQQNLMAKRQRRRYNLTSERVIDECRCLALARVTDVLQYEKVKDGHGRTSYRMQMTDFEELPDEAKAAIKKVKVKTIQLPNEDKGMLEILEIEIQMYDKASSLRDLGKHFGLFNDKVDVNVSGVVGHVHTTLSEVRECFESMTQEKREEWLEVKAKELTDGKD